ncbi:MAG: Ig-like domain-containing protein [Nitrososphaerota archaeon]
MEINSKIFLSLVALSIVFLIVNFIPIAFSQSSTVSVTLVVKTIDDKPLPNAKVKLYNTTDPSQILVGTTNTYGKVKFSILKDKSYGYVIEYPSGFKVGEGEIKFTGDVEDQEEILLDPAYVLSSWIHIVTDNYGRDPVPGVDVIITHEENKTITFAGKTDSNGKISFSYIPLGLKNYADYRVNISYANRFYADTYECSGANKEIIIKLPLFRVNVEITDIKNRPVAGIVAGVTENIQVEPIFKNISNATGYSIIKLVPEGEYYLVAKLGEHVVYVSEEKFRVQYRDLDLFIKANVVQFNLTVYDYDEERIASGFGADLIGEIRKAGKLVASSSTREGILRFGYVPLGEFELTIKLADIPIYSSSKYKIDETTAEGKIKANLYDVKIKLDGSRLVNETITRYLIGELKKNTLTINFNFTRGYVELKDIPSSSGYQLKLYFDNTVVSESSIDITQDDETVIHVLIGVNITLFTVNLNDKPASSYLEIYLQNGDKYASLEIGASGRVDIGELLTIPYILKGYVMDIEVASQNISPRKTGEEYVLKLSVRDVYVRIYDKDSESAIPEVLLELYVKRSKVSSITNSSGIAIFRNMPLTKCSFKTFYYGFKVGEGELNIDRDTEIFGVVASGILDLRLQVLDGEKIPLDGGKLTLTIGDSLIDVAIDSSGSAIVKNLPNTTIYISSFEYKKVKVKVSPSEFNLIKDDMFLSLTAEVYRLDGSIVMKNGKPLTSTKVNIYSQGVKIATKNLLENSSFQERIPKGEVRIEVFHKDVKVGDKTLVVDVTKSLQIIVNVYEFTCRFHDSFGKPIETIVKILDKSGYKIDEVKLDKSGFLKTLLPSGAYELNIEYEGSLYKIPFTVNDDKSLSFIIPINLIDPILVMSLPIFNIIAVVFPIMRKAKIRKSRKPTGRRERRVIPRI